jgi:hypothetical protein
VFKVNDKYIQMAKALLAEATDLAGDVESRAKSMEEAHGKPKLLARRRGSVRPR